MLNEATLKLLKVHNIAPETVSYVDENMLVTFKDGTQRRICETWSRRQPNCVSLKKLV